MSTTFTYDVFLSHNSKDKPRVRRIAERLRDAGLRVWFDEWNIKGGEIISLKIDEGLEQSRVLVLCVSANALASGWVALERSTAIHRDPSNEGRRFIPLLLSDCELPDTLRRYKYLDFRNETDPAFNELLTAATEEPKDLPTPPSRVPKKNWQSLRQDPLAEHERTLHSDVEWFGSLAITEDGNLLISGSSWSRENKALIRVWDLLTGKEVRSFGSPSHEVFAIVLTDNDKRLVSAGVDNSIRVWDVGSGRQLQVWKGHKEQIRSLAVLPERGLVFSASWDHTISTWDTNTGKCLDTIDSLVADPSCMAVLDNGNQIAVGDRDGYLTIWNTKSKEPLWRLEAHKGILTSLAVTPDGKYVATGGVDRTVRIWSVASEVCVGTLEGHHGRVMSVAISSDGKLIASAGFQDKTVRLWDLGSGSCLQHITDTYEYSPISVAFSSDGSRLVIGTALSRIYIYRLKTTPPARPIVKDQRYVNAKVVLLGEGTVGKTSLAHRLVDDKYVVRDRTHGMNVWPLQLPLPREDGIEREALLWDLAGQEDYRLIHQLFLDETALALLLVNPQKDDPFAEAGDWLKTLKAVSNQTDASREIARLLVFSQVDVGRMKLGDTKIDRFRAQHGFSNWIATSAKTGENCSDKVNGNKPSKLKQLIAKSIPWEHLPWTSTPRLLVELKNAMLSMRDKTDIRMVRFAELMQRLEQALPGEKFGESDARTAVTLLANQNLARPLKFGDLVLLQPELLNGYAGAIIRAARKHTDEIGAVLESAIYKGDFDFTGVERLKNRPDEELLLRALVQTFLDHSLCIAEDSTHGRHLVFPSQYRREKDIPHDPDIFVSYTFSGEWQTVWTTLVVRLWYSQEFKHKELWRNAVEFASPKGFTLGLKIDNKQGEGTATVSLYFDKEVPDELKAIFIEYVHRHLAKYGCEVTRDRRYLCSGCGSAVKDLDAVRKRLEAKREFITCQTCDERVVLTDFIEQRLKSDPVARKIMAMDETATRKLDTQALEQILIGHMMATCGEANQIFRPLTMFDYGIDGEVEFKDDNGKASGKRIYIQLKSGNSYLRKRKRDGTEIFDVTNDRHLDYWTSQPVDVYLVIRQTDEFTGAQTIRWMNVTTNLNERKSKKSRQIVFTGEKLDMEAVWKVRDQFFPPTDQRRK